MPPFQQGRAGYLIPAIKYAIAFAMAFFVCLHKPNVVGAIHESPEEDQKCIVGRGLAPAAYVGTGLLDGPF